MERCAASLDQLFKSDKFKDKVPDDVTILRQIASGLAYIHSRDQIHRDIKPQNILISASDPVVMKVADFGASKKTENGSCSWSGPCGTLNWSSPEMIQFNLDVENAMELRSKPPDRWGRISNKTDVFSAGLVFFSVLTKGENPFGAGLMITSNIYNGKLVDNFDGNGSFCI